MSVVSVVSARRQVKAKYRDLTIKACNNTLALMD